MQTSKPNRILYLPHLVKPYPKESFRGTVLRCLMKNGLDSFSFPGLPAPASNEKAISYSYLKYVFQFNTLYAHHPEVTGNRKPGMKKLRHQGMNLTQTIGQHHEHLIHRPFMRAPNEPVMVCPECFQANQHIHWSHELFFVDVCYKHKLRLVQIAKNDHDIFKLAQPVQRTVETHEYCNQVKDLCDLIYKDPVQISNLHKTFVENGIYNNKSSVFVRDVVQRVSGFMSTAYSESKTRILSKMNKRSCIPLALQLYKECAKCMTISYPLRLSILSANEKLEGHCDPANCDCDDFEIPLDDFKAILGLKSITESELARAKLPVDSQGKLHGPDIAKFFSKHFPKGIGRYYTKNKLPLDLAEIGFEQFIRNIQLYDGIECFAAWTTDKCKSITVVILEDSDKTTYSNLADAVLRLGTCESEARKLLRENFISAYRNEEGLVEVELHTIDEFLARHTTLEALANKVHLKKHIHEFGRILKELGVYPAVTPASRNSRQTYYLDQDWNESLLHQASGILHDRLFKKRCNKDPKVFGKKGITASYACF